MKGMVNMSEANHKISRQEWRKRYNHSQAQLRHYRTRNKELQAIVDQGFKDNPSEIESLETQIGVLLAENTSLKRKLRKYEGRRK